ncbi:MAG: hypothetical protein Q7S51_10250 [Gallionellaceae bacterium]|nr:hypothetical protein [Gallionellaceae bacterium]
MNPDLMSERRSSLRVKRDLEKATLAARCAWLLCQNLGAMAVTDNLILSDAVTKELEIAAAMHTRLERIAARLRALETVGVVKEETWP